MTYRPPYEPPADPAAHEADEAYLRHRASGQPLPGFDLDPRERQLWIRQTRRVKTVQALVVFWLCASPFVVVPLLLRHTPWWLAAVVAGVVGAVVGYLLPTNVPPPRHTPDTGGAYGVYDPRGPHGPTVMTDGLISCRCAPGFDAIGDGAYHAVAPISRFRVS